VAGWTGLEPAAFCVTGRRSNQLSYHPNKGEEAEARNRTGQVKSGFNFGGRSPTICGKFSYNYELQQKDCVRGHMFTERW
jgi:hypothetical protein